MICICVHIIWFLAGRFLKNLIYFETENHKTYNMYNIYYLMKERISFLHYTRRIFNMCTAKIWKIYTCTIFILYTYVRTLRILTVRPFSLETSTHPHQTEMIDGSVWVTRIFENRNWSKVRASAMCIGAYNMHSRLGRIDQYLYWNVWQETSFVILLAVACIHTYTLFVCIYNIICMFVQGDKWR